MGNLTPITGNYHTGKGQIFLQISGNDYLEDLGDTDAVSIAGELEKLDRFSNAFGTRTKTFSSVQQQSWSINLTLVQMTPRARALALLSDVSYLTQSAGTTDLGTLTTTQVAVGQVFELGKFDVDVQALKDLQTTPVDFTAGTHFEVDSKAGLIRIKALPDGIGNGLQATYNYPAIATSAKRLNAGIGSAPEITGKLIFRGLNTTGTQVVTTLHSVKLSPSGERNYIGDELVSVQLTGEVIADTSQSAGFEYGWERDLS